MPPQIITYPRLDTVKLSRNVGAKAAIRTIATKDAQNRRPLPRVLGPSSRDNSFIVFPSTR
jgi:hypothetical protein